MELNVNEVAERMQPPVVLTADRHAGMLLPPGWTHDTGYRPEPAPLVVSTLSAVVAYCAAAIDAGVRINTHGLEPGLVITVDSVTQVSVRGPLLPVSRDYSRPCYMVATAIVPAVHLGVWQSLEQALMQLQTVYAPSPARADLIGLLSTVTENDVRTSTDDGISQLVAVQKGLKAGLVAVPNPVLLAPARTFTEVEQPASPLLLRMRKGPDQPQVMLTEADGGAWRLQAMASVAVALRSAVITTVQVIA